MTAARRLQHPGIVAVYEYGNEADMAFIVMENVKGLLSATHRTQRLFERIREDLNDPARALEREGRTRGRRRPKYVIRPIVSDGSLLDGVG